MAKGKGSIKDKFLKEVGSNIKNLRKGSGLSMGKLGLEVGLSRMQISRIESGYNITLSTILKLAIALKVNPSELVNFSVKSKETDLEDLVNSNKASKLKPKSKST
ncbi:MAG TPA: helix-turn-helix transcriptional regulator [Flavobacteriales bacterium]|nr:helix-turn-helix transcriptional regulator [Flavobacteriales bacterium]HRJ37983.1 helix-turn-helix transcriptional regulator [Flavobacteriales bacterium]